MFSWIRIFLNRITEYLFNKKKINQDVKKVSRYNHLTKEDTYSTSKESDKKKKSKKSINSEKKKTVKKVDMKFDARSMKVSRNKK